MAANASDNAAAASPFEEHGPGATLKTPPARGAGAAIAKSAVPPRSCSSAYSRYFTVPVKRHRGEPGHTGTDRIW